MSATQADYTAAANAIASVLMKDIRNSVEAHIRSEVPSIFQGRAVAALSQVYSQVPAIAGECAKAAVDAVDAERAKVQS